MRKENFIERSLLLHNKKYDYSLVDYVNNYTKVKIVCPVHGVFEQRPNGHLKGEGCRKCVFDKQRKTSIDFISEARKIHGDKYGYSLVEYKNINEKVKIICPIHGVFEQIPANHLKGTTCLKCSSINRRVGSDGFIKNASEKHNKKYNYSLVDYQSSHKKIKIICPKHGIFEQTPHSHLKGQGCPICNDSKGEINIGYLLSSNNIDFIRQYKFFDCKNKKQLPFDFYLPDLNICIEFNGIQHYKSVTAFGGEKAFITTKNNDKIKASYCKKNNIPLIIIKYNEDVNNLLLRIEKWVD